MKTINPNNLKKPKSKTGSALKLIFSIPLFALVGGYFVITSYYETSIHENNSEENEQVEFTIEEGSTTEQIFSQLVENKLIRDNKNLVYKYYLRKSGLGTTIQAGVFRIPKNLSMVELVDTLQNAGINDLWVTIQEGLRKEEIAEILAIEFTKHDNSVFDKIDFLALTEDQEFISRFEFPPELTNLEGYLFPDRYLLSIEATSENVLTTLINTFFTKVTENVTYQDIIIASLIEREANSDESRSLVSGIIRKRLEEGWFLGIDAANLYYHDDWNYELTYQDLQIDHPYNTRVNTGLPPTPICNPGLSSVNASLNPEKSVYYYYITGLDGQFYYATTASEHNQNIANHLR
jgi:UPF0755 protein